MPSTPSSTSSSSPSLSLQTTATSNPASPQVSFCAIQLEIAEKAENDLKHVEFNRGKSLEDLFEGLAILSPRSLEEGIKAAKRARGKRPMADISVETFYVMDSDKESKESSPGAESAASSDRGEASKPSTKESTPASIGAASSQSTASSSVDKDQMKFISGNPFVEVTKGVIHLYKENQTTSLEEGVIRSQMLCK